MLFGHQRRPEPAWITTRIGGVWADPCTPPQQAMHGGHHGGIG